MKLRCPFCKQESFRRGLVDHHLQVGGRTYATKFPADICNNCSEEQVTSRDLGRFEYDVARHIASGGPGGPEEFAHLRRFLGLPALEFARLLDVDPSTVSRWENGAPFNRVTWNALCDLVIDKIEKRTVTQDRLLGVSPGPWKPRIPPLN